MSAPPALGPPPIGGDEDGANRIHLFTWAFQVVSIIFVTARMYSRIKLTRNLWWDDYLICAAIFLDLVISIMWSSYAERGYARHMYYLTPEQLVGAFELNTISRSLCVLCIALGKMSVAFLIERIAPAGSWRKWMLRGISISIAVSASITFVIFYAQCQPVQAIWNKSIIAKGMGSCWDQTAINTWNMIVSSYWTFLDFALAFIPIDMIWKLQMRKRTKISLCFLLGLGVFAGICAAIKTSKIPITIKGKRDLTWQTIELLMWGGTEMNVIIIAACIPTLRPLYLIIFRQPGAEYYVGGSRQRQQASYAKATDYNNLGSTNKSNNRGSTIRGKPLTGRTKVSSMGNQKSVDDDRAIMVEDTIFVESRELRGTDVEGQEEVQWGQRGQAVLMTDMGRAANGQEGRRANNGV